MIQGTLHFRLSSWSTWTYPPTETENLCFYGLSDFPPPKTSAKWSSHLFKKAKHSLTVSHGINHQAVQKLDNTTTG